MVKQPGRSHGWWSNGQLQGETQGPPNCVMDVPVLLNLI